MKVDRLRPLFIPVSSRHATQLAQTHMTLTHTRAYVFALVVIHHLPGELDHYT